MHPAGKRVDRHEIGNELVKRDLTAFRVAREAYCKFHNIDWKKIDRDEKVEHLGEIEKYLKNLPNRVLAGNELAISMDKKLHKNKCDTAEALKFLKYMQSKDHKMPSSVAFIEGGTKKSDKSHGTVDKKPAAEEPRETNAPPGSDVEAPVSPGTTEGTTGAPRPEDGRPPETPRPGTRSQREMNDRNAFMAIYGIVRDAETKKGVKAVIHISGPEKHGGVTSNTGVYYQGVGTEGFDYVVECRASGYKHEKKENVEIIRVGRNSVRTRVDFELTKEKDKPGVTRRIAASTGGRIELHIRKFLTAFVIILAGVFVSLAAGCAWLMAAFSSWAFLCFIPEPVPIERLKKSGIGMMINLNLNEETADGSKVTRGKAIGKALKDYFGADRSNSGLGVLRSILKVTTICLFVAGVKYCTVPWQGILLPIIAFVGYFWMSPSIERDNPAAVIEATIRFGALGCFIIPFWIFWSQFNSLSLAFIAFAFFAVPPAYKNETEGEKDLMSFFSKIWFAVLMFLALLGCGVIPGISFGPSWGLHGALAIFFIYFWVICAVAGFFSSHEARPVIGLFMLLIATVIYGMTAGTQDVGMALFGPYFPQVFKTITDVSKPINDAFTQVGGTFGTAWQLLVNPVAYANNMMNASYTSDPLSKVTGPLGVEIDDVRATPIYPYSPFSIIVKLRNRGASPAGNIEVNISAYETWSPKQQTAGLVKDKMVLGDLGFTEEETQTCTDIYGDKAATKETIATCTQSVNDGKPLQRLDIRQVIFSTHYDREAGSEQGLTCEVINRYALRESKFRKKWGIQFIPITASVAYDYNMSSSLDVSFISAEEWSRMTEDEEAFVPQRKEAAKNTNSPALLNLDTIEQPIREDTPFHLGIALAPAKTTGTISDVYYITVTLPSALAENLNYCMPETDDRLKSSGEGTMNADGSMTLVWSNEVKQRTPTRAIFCSFNGMAMQGNASQSFLVQANASFRFKTSSVETTSVEWGGGVVCCTKDAHCPYPEIQTCDAAKQECILKALSVTLPAALKLGDQGYCADKKGDYPQDSTSWCKEGYGQCVEGECAPGLTCMPVTVSTAMNLCCYQGKENECKDAYLVNKAAS